MGGNNSSADLRRAQFGEPEAIQIVWDKYDKDGNGILDKKEYRKLLNDMYPIVYEGCPNPPTKKEAIEKWWSYDANNDGVISYDEFQQLVAKELVLLAPK
mmetsp:Transcript_131043/g.195293  ORF Transcript_131043/g.195293 Transcript_131043/m.195293 type:complete len:100 (-) Transcript_131043:31-330(-)